MLMEYSISNVLALETQITAYISKSIYAERTDGDLGHHTTSTD
jgi:hypothetical protein